jgi:nuclear transport factor 2 (NTF2) superfamily protein
MASSNRWQSGSSWVRRRFARNPKKRMRTNENWEFDENGLMRVRLACINDLPINEADRKYHWPLGRRPDAHPGLSDLGF